MKLSIEEFERTSNYWIAKDKEKNNLSKEDAYKAISDFAQANKNGVLGTCHDNQCRCTPVDYKFYDGAFWIFTEGGQKFAHLFYNTNVSFAVYDTAGTFTNLHSLQVIGTINFVELFNEEYLKALETFGYPEKGIRQLPYPMYLIKLTPSEMILLNSDLKKQGFNTRAVVTFD